MPAKLVLKDVDTVRPFPVTLHVSLLQTKKTLSHLQSLHAYECIRVDLETLLCSQASSDYLTGHGLPLVEGSNPSWDFPFFVVVETNTLKEGKERKMGREEPEGTQREGRRGMVKGEGERGGRGREREKGREGGRGRRKKQRKNTKTHISFCSFLFLQSSLYFKDKDLKFIFLGVSLYLPFTLHKKRQCKVF